MPGKLCRISSVTGNAYVSMSYRWFNEYKLSFLFGVGAFFVEQLCQGTFHLKHRNLLCFLYKEETRCMTK